MLTTECEGLRGGYVIGSIDSVWKSTFENLVFCDSQMCVCVFCVYRWSACNVYSWWFSTHHPMWVRCKFVCVKILEKQNFDVFVSSDPQFCPSPGNSWFYHVFTHFYTFPLYLPRRLHGNVADPPLRKETQTELDGLWRFLEKLCYWLREHRANIVPSRTAGKPEVKVQLAHR